MLPAYETTLASSQPFQLARSSFAVQATDSRWNTPLAGSTRPDRLYPPIPSKNSPATNIEKISGSGTALVTVVANAAPRRECAKVVG